MNTRILPVHEWDRAAIESPSHVLPYIEPHNVALAVVEKEGRIVARLGVYAVSYFEGLWVDPEYRGNPGVMRALLRQAIALPQRRGEHWCLGGVTSDEMRGFLDRLGTKIQSDFYAVRIDAKNGDEYV